MRDIIDSINRNPAPVIEEKPEIIEEEAINDIEEEEEILNDEIKEDNKEEDNSINYWRRRR